MVFETASSTETHHLTGANDDADDQSNLHKLLKTAKFRLIGLNSSFVKRLNGKILNEFHLNERSFGERMRLKESHPTDDWQTELHRDYQTIGRAISQTIDAESEHSEETETPPSKKFRLKPKKRLLKFLRRLSLKGVYESMNLNLYEELKPSGKDEEEKVKKKKKKKVMKKIRKITMDVCTNISGGVHLMDAGYSYPDQHYSYDSYFGARSMYINYHGYDYKANDYSYNTTIIYGPRYM